MTQPLSTILSNVPDWNSLIPGVTKWADLARRHTLISHREHGFLIAKDGTSLAEVGGNNVSVDFSRYANLLPGNIVVHSHPDMSPISPQDGNVATVGDLAYVVAIARDGSLTATHGFDKEKVGPWIVADVNSLVDTGSEILQSLGMERRLSVSVSLHNVWLKIAERGIADYHFTIGPELEAGLKQFDRLLAKGQQ